MGILLQKYRFAYEKYFKRYEKCYIFVINQFNSMRNGIFNFISHTIILLILQQLTL